MESWRSIGVRKKGDERKKPLGLHRLEWAPPKRRDQNFRLSTVLEIPRHINIRYMCVYIRYIFIYMSHLVRITVERRKRSSEISLLILGTCMCVEDAYLYVYIYMYTYNYTKLPTSRKLTNHSCNCETGNLRIVV